MTSDEITEMARESQLFDSRDNLINVPADYAGSICLFAQLVAAKERERCAKKCDDNAAQLGAGLGNTALRVTALDIRAGRA